jgi:hypothetical protein
MRKKSIYLYCFLSALFLFPGLAFSQWSNDPSVNTPVATAPDSQTNYTVVHDGHGGYFVVWQDGRNDPTTDWDIYAQYFNSAGEPQWAANGIVVCNAYYQQWFPKVILDGLGGIIVSWEDEWDVSTDIYAQRLDASGAPQWTANGIPVIATTDDDECGWLVSDGVGGAIVMTYGGAVNRVGVSGFLPWRDADDPVLYSTSGNSRGPKLMADGAGGAILTWVEDDEVAVQRVDHDGTLLWNNGDPVMLTGHGYNVMCPRIISDSSGGAIVIWADGRGQPTIPLYAQRVNSNGPPQWAANGIQITGSDLPGPTHGLASDGAGGAFVTWFDRSDNNLYARRISHDGTLLWPGAAQLTTAGDFSVDAICEGALRKTVEDGSGGFITVWLNNSDEIRAQRVNGSGTPLWTAGGVVLSNVDSPKECPRIEGNGQGGAVAIWRDERNDATTGPDIYMQGVNAEGSLGDPGFVEPEPTYDATGTWDYASTNNWADGTADDCEPDPDARGTVTITQTGNNFTLAIHGGDTFTGTVSGATYTTFSSQIVGPGETETLYITFTVSSSSSCSGTITWSWTDGWDWCEGGSELTFAKLPDELAVDFKTAGIYVYDNDTWNRIYKGIDPEDLCAFGAYLTADFGTTYGLYLYDAGVWSRIYRGAPIEKMARFGTKLAVDFGTYGIYEYTYATDTWSRIYSGTAPRDSIVGFGDTLAVDFKTAGIYLYDAGVWNRIYKGVDPVSITSFGNSLAVDFGTASGLYLYEYATTTWSRIYKGVAIEEMTECNGKLAADFGTYGLYLYDPNTDTWSRIYKGVAIDRITACGTGLAVDFGTYGIYLYDPDAASWTRIYTGTAPRDEFCACDVFE